MDKGERIIDLRKEEKFIEAYVSLRNRYKELLLTRQVSVTETKEWLKNKQVEVRGLVQHDFLLGSAILYPDRDGEVTVFVRDLQRGIGTRLLNVIEQVAKEKRMKSVWAWVLFDNEAARRAFQKNGYAVERQSLRSHEGKDRSGVIFRKRIF